MRAADQRRDPLQGLGVRDRCAAELEDRQLTHRPTSGEPASASGKRRAALYGDAIDCGEAVRRTTIAASYTPAFGRPAEAGRRAGGGEKRRNAVSCRRPGSSGKAARWPSAVSSGAEQRGTGRIEVYRCV